MEQIRQFLSGAIALFDASCPCWSREECEAVASKILGSARRHCQGDEKLVGTNLVAALILALEQQLDRQERTAFRDLRTGVRRG